MPNFIYLSPEPCTSGLSHGVEPTLTDPVGIRPTSWANCRSFDPKSVGSPRHGEFELDVLDCTIRIWLRTHSSEAVAQATLQRANLLPLQSIGWVSSRLRLRND